MKKSRTVRPTAGVESPTTRRLPLVELLIDTEAELFDLAVRSGLQVLDAMLEEDRTGGGGDLRAALRAPSRPHGVAGRDGAQYRRPRGAEGIDPPPPGPLWAPGGAAPDLPDDGPDRSTAAAHRRAAVGRREHPRLCPESGAVSGRHPQPQCE